VICTQDSSTIRVVPEQLGGRGGLLELLRRSDGDIAGLWASLATCEAWEAVHRSDVQLLSPLPTPPRVLCVGKNYADHVREVDESLPGISKPELPPAPIIFTKSPLSVVGPGEPVLWTGVSQQVDYEGELAVVIGKGGRGITAQDALSHVFGYTVCNDVTARDLQKLHQQWYLAKSQDTFCPLGPVVVAPSQVAAGPDAEPEVAVRTYVDNELRQDGRTTQMIHSVAQLIATISAGVSLQPGDVLATGTPAGVGAATGRFLKPGSVVRVEIDGIGALENPVVHA